MATATAAKKEADLSPKAKKFIKGLFIATGGLALASGAATIAGGALLATSGAGAGMVVLGAATGLIAANGIVASVGIIRTMVGLVDKGNFENFKGKKDLPLNKHQKFLAHPVVAAVTSGVSLAAGIGLIAATGGVLPTVIAAYLIVAGGMGVAKGGLKLLGAGLKKLFVPAKKAEASNDNAIPQAAANAPKLAGKTVKKGFDAAAADKKPAPKAAKPAAAPKKPKLG
jgi:hypothetical protein